MLSIPAIVGGAGWLCLTFGTASLAGRFGAGEWYRSLRKPRWNPPESVFPAVWTILYFLMAIAAWLVWRQHGLAEAALPLMCYVVQLLLNAGWSSLFFGRHEIGAALVELVVLWAAIAATMALFWMSVPLAGFLLVPYLAWVTFAGVLNATVWQMNRAPKRLGQ